LDTNYAKVFSCLCQNQPNLKVLRFVGVAVEEEQWPRGLGSLLSLTHLHTLHVDFALLMAPDDEPDHRDHSNLLPSSLKHICVTNVTVKMLQKEWDFMDEVEEGILDPDASEYEAAKRGKDFIMNPTPTFALQSFTMNLDDQYEDIMRYPIASDDVLEHLRAAVMHAQLRGVVYQVYAKSHGTETKRLLVEAPPL
jgi:hypothetical protein